MVNRFFVVAASIVVADQLTKYLAQSADIPITSFLSITHTTNTGVSFGLLQGYSIIPLLASIAVIAGILYYYKELEHPLPFALILGGAAGNLLDRLVYGAVHDFIAFSFWPTFNVADSAITVGGLLLGYYYLKGGRSLPITVL